MTTSKASWTTEFPAHIDEFDSDGFTLLEGVVPPECLEAWAIILQAHDEYIHNDAIGSMGERGNYLVTDGPTTFRLLPGLDAVYDYCRVLVNGVCGRDIIRSPYPRSIVNAKVYADDGSQGLHYDSQPITCLLFVTEGAPLEIQFLDGTWHTIDPVPGAIAIFQGRKMLHRVPPGEEGQFRVTIPMNYYFPEDTYRPEGLDDAIYGNVDL